MTWLRRYGSAKPQSKFRSVVVAVLGFVFQGARGNYRFSPTPTCACPLSGAYLFLVPEKTDSAGRFYAAAARGICGCRLPSNAGAHDRQRKAWRAGLARSLWNWRHEFDRDTYELAWEQAARNHKPRKRAAR